jgi:hypothetical protein
LSYKDFLGEKIMKSVTKHIQDLTGKSFSAVNFDKLAAEFSGNMKRISARDRQLEEEYYNPSPDMKRAEKLKMLVAKAIEQESDRVNGSMPVISTFEAYQVAKRAYSENSRDVGLANLTTYLEKGWKRDREASLNTEEVVKLADHYKKNFPKSSAKKVLAGMVENGYFDLPVNELMGISSEIRSQADYEYQITANGLASNSPRNQKARQFILAAVNGGRIASEEDSDNDEDDLQGDSSDSDEDMKEELIKFLSGLEESPDDDAFHAWAEGKGYNIHKVEAMAYELARLFAKGEDEDTEEETDKGSKKGSSRRRANEQEDDEEFDEESDEFEPDEFEPDEFEPDEEDAYIETRGDKYSASFGNKHLGNFVEWQDAAAAIAEEGRKYNFTPNVWEVSDHGNFSIVEDFDWDAILEKPSEDEEDFEDGDAVEDNY